MSAATASVTIATMLFSMPLGAAEVQRDAKKWLILEFPDGARGGRGRIHGEGDYSKLPQRFDRSAFLKQFLECGAKDPQYVVAVTHRFHIISRSTSRDTRVVHCLERRLAYNFNAGIGSNDPSKIMGIDSSPFCKIDPTIACRVDVKAKAN